MIMQTAPYSESVDTMYPQTGTFSLSDNTRTYPSFNENVYLLMKGFNAIKVHGPVCNAEIVLIWELNRRYGTVLWINAENKIDDILVFPFKDNSGTVTFEGKAIDPDKNWEATLEFTFVNLTQEEIDELNSSDSS
jgi:hypothetical protein